MKSCLNCETIYNTEKYKNCPVCKTPNIKVKEFERVRKSLKKVTDQNTNQIQEVEEQNLVVMSKIDLDFDE